MASFHYLLERGSFENFPLFTSATDRLFKPFKEYSKEKYLSTSEIYLGINDTKSTRNFMKMS